MTSASDVATCTFLGVRVHNVDSEQALHLLDAFVREGRPHHVVTVNPEFVMEARRMPEFRDVLTRAHLALPDGVGLLLAARIQGTRLKERVTGVDTLARAAAMAARKGYRLFLLGAAPGIAEETARRLQQASPGLEIAGTYAGSPAPEEEDEIVARIIAAAPDMLFVAYGAPRQDIWIARNLHRLNVPVAMGVGGAFDFIAGRAKRAPKWMQRAGLEWLHRLVREPWRWRRMLALPRFLIRVVAERVTGGVGGRVRSL
jgi:N-acetylglucosaminyldiphosphoundecaprenol N-acetyl-beta-D-mannosaminyltransferase